RLVALALVAIMPATLLGVDGTAAFLAGSNGVRVNGESSRSGRTIFPGDRVTTDARSNGLIDSRELSVNVAHDSALTYNGKTIKFEGGTVIFAIKPHSSGQETVQVADLSVSAVTMERMAKFATTNAGGVEKVIAL